MDIVLNVTLGELDLAEELEKYYDEDGDLIGAGTIGSAVVQKITHLALKGAYGNELQKRVQAIRDEEIRAQLAPIIADALAKPIQKTNEYGEKRGGELTMHELIVERAHAYLKEPADNYRRDKGTVLQVALNRAVETAFHAEIAQAVKDVKDAVAGRVGEMVAEAVAKAR